MKTKIFVTLSFFLVIISFISFIFVNGDNKLKIGQVWRYEPNNPFSKIKKHIDYKIIDINDGKVQYVDILKNDTNYSSEYLFKVQSFLIKDIK